MTETAAAVKGTSAANKQLFPILLVNFIDMLGYSIVLPFMVVIVLKLGGNEITYGIMGATYSFFQLIGAPILGSWSDKFGRKKILIVCTAGTFVGWLIFIFALYLPQSFVHLSLPTGAVLLSVPLLILFCGRAIDGITGGSVSVANAYLADISAHADRKRNFGRMSAAANLGLIFGPVLSGLLGATHWGNVLPVAAAAFIALVAIVVIIARLKNYVPGHAEGPLPTDDAALPLQNRSTETTVTKDHVRILSIPHVRYFVTMYFIIFLGFNFFYVAFPVYAAQQLHWKVLKLGLFFSFLSGMLVVVQGPVLGHMPKKISSASLVIVGNIILAAGFACFRSSSIVVLYTGAFLFAVGNGLMWSSFLAIMSNIVDDRYQGRVQGFAGSAGSLASIIGLLSGAFLYKVLSANIFLVVSLFMLLIALCAWPLISIEKNNNTSL